MQNLAKLCAVVALCLGVTGAVQAADQRARAGTVKVRISRPPAGVSTARTHLSKPSPIVGRSKPMAFVSAPKAPLTFGKVAGIGPTQLKAETTAHVAANCPFRLMASFRGLVGGATAGGAAIPPQLMKVTINGKEVRVGTEFVEIATGGPTPPGGVDVPIVVEIQTAGVLAYPAGRYEGNLALTVRGG